MTATNTAPEQMSLSLDALVPEAEPTVHDFLHCIGQSFYTVEEFIKEAEVYGVSRRLRSVPKDLDPEKSRIYLASGAGHVSAPHFCDKCAGTMPCENCKGLGRVARPVAPIDPLAPLALPAKKRGRVPQPTLQCAKCSGKGTQPTNRASLPEPSTAVVRNGRRVVICGRCSAEHELTPARGGKVFGYFVPDRIEIVLRISDDAAKVVAILGESMGIKIEGGPDDEVYRVSGTIDPTHPQAAELLKALGVDADDVKADIIGKLQALPGAVITGVVHEVRRGCGVRVHGGAYAVSAAKSPLVLIDPAIEYDGPHFRGIVALSDDESKDLKDHTDGKRQVVLHRRELEVVTDEQAALAS